MRVSEHWLRDWVQPESRGAELAEQLTMVGLEVDKIEPAAPPFEQVVVGRVASLKPHPQAERLQIAMVDIGSDAPLQIVCGAPNVRVDDCYPTAVPGAQMPNGISIKATELRGVESQGMLCSAKELGLSEEGAGLLVLPSDSTPGVDIRELLKLDDTIIEIDLTPNRGDCLGIAGIAREVSVFNRCTLTLPDIEPITAQIDEVFPVTLSAPKACPRFVGRVIRDIDPTAPSPLWLTERLRRAGVRSISAVVDVTNYVMLELNHPMHAFDLNKLEGGINVRYAKAGEQLRLLNEQVIEPDSETLLITDSNGPVALAGIMGGADTEVSARSQHIFFECAYFSQLDIAGKARRYGLHTDASQRFERGVNPHGQMRAVERATQLLLEITGGTPGPLIDTHHTEYLPQNKEIRLRGKRIEQVLGMSVSAEVVEDILSRLGIDLQNTVEGWLATPPSTRSDITLEVDLIEEVGRIHGYQHLPRINSKSRLPLASCPEDYISTARIQQTLVQRGYFEAITYSFIDPELQRLFEPEQKPITLANPISSEMAVMRTSIWPGLIKTLLANQARQQQHIRLFEIGLNFLGTPDHVIQESYLAGLASGDVWPEQWGMDRRRLDFFDVKSDVEALLTPTGQAVQFVAAEHPALHPGQTAQIQDQVGQQIGWLGALHPAVQNQLDLELPCFLFELKLDAVQHAKLPVAKELSKFPQSRRDLAIVVADTVSTDSVMQTIHNYAGEYLRHVTLFDVYRGKGIEKGHKSLAFGLIFQDFSGSLTDQTLDAASAAIVNGIAQDFGGKLRD